MTATERPRSARPMPAGDAVRTAAIWEHVVDDLRDGLDPFAVEPAFEETLSGLHTRELTGADVFQRLFGADPA